MNIKLVVVLCVTFVGFVWCQSGTDLPECIWHDPVKQADEWRLYHKQPCKITVFKPEEETVEDKRYEYGSAQFSFNVYVSDKIGPHRKIPETFHENCKKLNYDDVRLKASIVIIYHNEAYSVLVRMIDSIIERTPDHLLHEIILYDDASIPEHVIEEHIKDYANYANWSSKLKYFKSVERLGLIRAKTYASREATGDVLVFLDSHCEVNNRWIEPLLQVIQNNRTTVVLPVVDLIQPLNFEYSQAMVAKGGFDWALNFKWEYFDWSYFDIAENTVKPFNSAAMSGGLVAVDREYFKELGEYDENMEIWGGEQIEFSIRTWLCGGSVKIAPCSRVGHVFRMRRPYTGKPGVDTNAYNSLRTVKVWFDEKWQEKFFEQRPRTRKMDAGDLSARLELKNRLKCRDFDWYLDNVYPKLKPTKHEEL